MQQMCWYANFHDRHVLQRCSLYEMHKLQAAASQEADIPVSPLLMNCSELKTHAEAPAQVKLS